MGYLTGSTPGLTRPLSSRARQSTVSAPPVTTGTSAGARAANSLRASHPEFAPRRDAGTGPNSFNKSSNSPGASKLEFYRCRPPSAAPGLAILGIPRPRPLGAPSRPPSAAVLGRYLDCGVSRSRVAIAVIARVSTSRSLKSLANLSKPSGSDNQGPSKRSICSVSRRAVVTCAQYAHNNGCVSFRNQSVGSAPVTARQSSCCSSVRCSGGTGRASLCRLATTAKAAADFRGTYLSLLVPIFCP